MKSIVKKILLTLSAVMLFAVVLCFNASALEATGECGDNVTWSFNSETGELVIEGTGETYDYSMAGSPFYREEFTSVVIKDGVTGIGDNLFYYCSYLKNISISTSVTRIGVSAFDSCCGIESVTIPGTVLVIEDRAFEDCDSLGQLTIQNGTQEIGSNAFSCCSSLDSVTIPDSVTRIATGAFDYTEWYDLQNEGVVYIGKILYGYKGEFPEYTKIAVKEGTVTIADSAFKNCEEIISATIPGSVTTIGVYAFYSCRGLQTVAFSEGLTEIGGGAFEYCEALTAVVLPMSARTIGAEAFANCSAIKTLDLGGAVTIGKNAFNYCESIEAVVLPESVESIGDEAFGFCSGISSLTFGSGVKEMGAAAFRDCESLTSVTVPGSVSVIKENAFANCSGLKKVTLSEGTTEIEEKAFNYCDSLESVDLPLSLKKIDDYAFSGCYNLKTFNYKGYPSDLENMEYDDSYYGVFNYVKINFHYGTSHNYQEIVSKATLKNDGKIDTVCSLCSEISKSVVIKKIYTIKLNNKKFICTGKAINPSVIVKDDDGKKLTSGTDYVVTYPEGTEATGKYKVKVTFKGNYSGTKTLAFTVLPGKVENLTAKPDAEYVTLKWSKVPGATSYIVYMYVSDEYGSGYLQIGSTSKNSFKIKNLTEKTKYKFKVQAYAEKKNKTYLSESASTVSTKTLKKKYVLLPYTELFVCEGDNYTPTVKKYPKDAKIKWKTSKKSVAKISSKGKITGVKAGKATITAYFKMNGKTYKDKCTVYVTKPSIMLSQTYAQVPYYESIDLYCYTNPSDIDVEWSSSNTSVATVNQIGTVIPKKIGSTVITAKFTFKGKTYKATCDIDVVKQEKIIITGVYINTDSLGGVKPSVTIKNNTYNDIKYIELETEYRNKFGDPAYCDLSGRYKETLKVESGLYGRTTKTFTWNPVIYNYNVHRVDITSAKITYVDNRTETIDFNYVWCSSQYYY